MTITQTATAKPTHRIFRVSGEGKCANWTEIGAAWPNKDGHGFSITCDAMQGSSVAAREEAKHLGRGTGWATPTRSVSSRGNGGTPQ